MKKAATEKKCLFILLVLFFTFLLTGYSFAVDESAENCILCHGHQGLDVIDETGNLKSISVNPEDYKNSIHKNVTCRGCHTSITEVPHKKSVNKVNCGVMCHLKKGIAVGSYSHSKIYDSFMVSVHGPANEDTPNCLYCHPQNMPKKDIQMSRFDILIECSQCHIDDKTMSKYGISADVVKSYKESIHGKLFFLEHGNGGVICTECHSVHNIASKESETSPISNKNLEKTCAGAETAMEGCHKATNPNFVFSFSHAKDKEATFTKINKIRNTVSYLTIGIFYLFCIINILRALRE